MNVLRIPAGRMEQVLRGLSDVRVLVPSGAGRKGGYVVLGPAVKLPQECGDHTKPSSPPKGIVFPNNETLLSYLLGVKGEIAVTAADHSVGRTILYGTPPCDTAAFAVLDAALLKDVPEPVYAEKRRSFGVIGMACSRAGRWCLCTSVGLSPRSTQGADLMVYPDGGDFYVQRVTGRLDQLWEQLAAKGVKVPDEALASISAKYDFAVDNFIFQADRLVEALEKKFGDEYWKDFSSRCVSCGICTYLCPTCHCFDIVDVAAGELAGRRVRTWDTCQFPEFTGETSAHNPRKEKSARQRQRVLHKFLYFWKNHGMMMCTGCGRCIRYCPVDINIAEGVMKLGGLK